MTHVSFRFVIVFLVCSFFTVSAVPKDEVWKCVRWTWSGQELLKRVICLEWRKEDCDKRLHKEICKSGK